MRVKRVLALVGAVACTLSLVSCSNPFKKEEVKLTVWNMEDQDFLEKMGKEFAEKYKKDAVIEIVIGDKPESSMTDYIWKSIYKRKSYRTNNYQIKHT